ncbi:late competence development ComFB family protein [Paenibacillus turpanensis]|uniref:late competence development ComFB family protein n=1 Tax=Paenibacillus turpanensis TaxID=2689078 RepID=UPI00140B43A5|nr:late competence development ComFB family protein [Paenibacillus turpanensis]
MFNAIERIAQDLYIEFEKQYDLSCKCHQCKEDILCIVLNRIPPKYTSTQKGELFIKALYLDPQLQSDIMRELMNASLIVKDNRHHDPV